MGGTGPYGPLESLAKGMLMDWTVNADGVPGFCENPSNSPRRMEGDGDESGIRRARRVSDWIQAVCLQIQGCRMA